jgi:23S rRNA pseudouridine1911/1915/1917 synthase
LDGLSEVGRQAAKAFPRQALHAYRLGFVHPVSGKPVVFESELPSDIKNLIKALEIE